MAFARGKWANSICDRCSFQFKFLDMVTEPGTLLRVCHECNDGRWSMVDHPQNHPPKKLTDAVGLRDPRPKQNLVIDEYAMAQDVQPEVVEYISLFLLTP